MSCNVNMGAKWVLVAWFSGIGVSAGAEPVRQTRFSWHVGRECREARGGCLLVWYGENVARNEWREWKGGKGSSEARVERLTSSLWPVRSW